MLNFELNILVSSLMYVLPNECFLLFAHLRVVKFIVGAEIAQVSGKV